MPLRCAPLVLLMLLVSFHVFGAEWPSEGAVATREFALGHLQSAQEHWAKAIADAEATGVTDVEMERLLTAAAPAYQMLGRCGEAEALLKRALAIRQVSMGELDVATGMNNLGAIYQEQAKYAEARELQAKALATAERLLTSDDPRLIPFLTHSATLARAFRDYGTAQQMLERARAIGERPENKVDALTRARILRHLGGTYDAVGLAAKAEEANRQSLALYETSIGPGQVEVASVLNNLGQALAERQASLEALSHLQRAADICEKNGAQRTRTCLAVLVNVSTVKIDLGEYAEAEETATQLAKAGGSDTIAAAAWNNLGKAMEMQGRYKEAELPLERSIRLWSQAVGEAQPETARVMTNLGGVYMEEHKPAKAELLYRRASEIDRSVSGSESLRVGTDLERYARLRIAQRRYEEAEDMLRHAIAIDTAGSDGATPLASDALFDMALVRYREHRLADAASFYSQGIALETAAGQRHLSRMAPVLDNYSRVLREMSDYAQAEQLSTEAMGIRVKAALRAEALH